ncbi:MAG TPA: hypothetical protein VND64_06905, partial [Pirellulales bacterium]|nr:hypothetical protein [Pirellulales bacterium]
MRLPRFLGRKRRKTRDNPRPRRSRLEFLETRRLLIAPPGFTTLNDPLATNGTVVQGISGSNVVGQYADSAGTHGFLYNGTSYTTLNDPFAAGYTSAHGVSGNNIVGDYWSGSAWYGFLYNGSSWTQLNDPLATGNTAAIGIDGNNIVGQYYVGSAIHAFFYNGSTYTTLDDPLATNGTAAYGISGNSIVGGYLDGSVQHGFLYNLATGKYTTIDEPLATSGTAAVGIQGNDIVGWFGDPTGYHGYLNNGSTYTAFDDPLGVGTTAAFGINSGNIVGQYIDSNGAYHGFLDAVPTFTVTNTADSGTGSLRQAMLDANAAGSFTPPATIDFAIPTSDPNYNSATGVWTISPLSALPTVTVPVTIDGTSQTGFGGTPVIDINGSQAGSGADGLAIDGGNSTVKSLVVNQFSGDGVRFDVAGGDALSGSMIGTNATGTAALGNGANGVEIETANNLVGGTSPAAKNVISANTWGVLITGTLASGNVVEGDFIGTNAAGTASLGNVYDGVDIYSADNTIGGGSAAARNVISGNHSNGIVIIGSSATGNVVDGNYVGTDVSGSTAVANSQFGVVVTNGANNNLIGSNGDGVNDAAEGNVVSGNLSNGIEFYGTAFGNVAAGNIVGLNAAGTAAIGNAGIGIDLSGGTTGNRVGSNAGDADHTAERNFVSGNLSVGVRLTDAGTSNNVVAGNYVGTNVAGTGAVPNLQSGVLIINGALNNLIGGTAPGTANVISGNTLDGVTISTVGTTTNVVEGNFIGTSASGAAALGNGERGVTLGAGATYNTIGGTTVAARNIISGNGWDGVAFDGASYNTVEGNYIGTDVSGTVAVGNGFNAASVWGGPLEGVMVRIGASNNTIGGTAPGAGNLISGNAASGVAFFDAGTTGNVVEGNFIGTDASGTAALGNAQRGVTLGLGNGAGPTYNTIGGTTAAARNIISGNAWDGVGFDGASYNTVEGNYIGTDVSGTVAVGNGFGAAAVWGGPLNGVMIRVGAADNVIGGSAPGAGNLISGNAYDGIALYDNGTSGNIIEGNLIGTNAAGTAALPNAANGVEVQASGNVIGGSSSAARNVISGNAANGMWIASSLATSNVVEGNYIGTDVSGSVAIGNQYFGIGIAAGANNNLIGTNGDGVNDAAEGNVISGNVSTGLPIFGPAYGNVVAGNIVGLNAAGTSVLGNGNFGIDLLDATTGNRIGVNVSDADTAAERNVLSSNAFDGIRLVGNGTSNNLVAGNYIGTDVTGTTAIANGSQAVEINNASQNTIGGSTASARNILSGNLASGVYITGSSATGNVVEGNYIGTDVSGSIAVGNHVFGIAIDGGANNNLIGTNGDGVNDATEGNVISGNLFSGIAISGPAFGNAVAGNIIGLNAAGTAAIGNGGNGIELYSGTTGNRVGAKAGDAGTAAERNIVSGNSQDGVGIFNAGTNNNLVAGNYIGTDVTGAHPLGNHAGVGVGFGAQNNVIGGTTTAARNVISANGTDGVYISDPGTSSNVVEDDFIGTNASGTAALGNGYWGIQIFNGAQSNRIGAAGSDADPTAERNIISANDNDGVGIGDSGTTGNIVAGNFIGTDVTGKAGLGNAHSGVWIVNGAQENLIGADGLGNTIAYNASAGVLVQVAGTTDNSIRGNAIFANQALGIDLGGSGTPVANDSQGHTGPNNFQNFPTITSARAGSSTTIAGYFAEANEPNTQITLEFFLNSAADRSGFGQGQTYLGSTTITTDGTGAADFNVTFQVATTAGQLVTATATDTSGNTSEF